VLHTNQDKTNEPRAKPSPPRFARSLARPPSLSNPERPPPPKQNKQNQVNEGVVLAVGPGRRTKAGDLLPPSVKEGDKVLLPEYGGALIKMDNKE
jgi:hypothetical protein